MRGKTTKLLSALCLACFLALGFGGAHAAGPYAGLDQMKPVTLKFNTYMTSKHAAYEVLNPFFKDVEKASKGKIKFRIYAGGLLLKAQESLRGVSDGTCDAALITTTYHSSFLPNINLLGDILLLTDDAAATAAASTEFLLLRDQYFGEELKKNNIIMFGGFYATNPYPTLTGKPIRTFAEIKGKKIRTAGAAWVRLAKGLDVTSVTIPISEAYEGLQRGTIDGVWGTVEFLRSYNLWDVAKYVTDYPTGCYCGSCAMTFNRDSWNKLPKVAKQIILDHMAFIPAGITLISYGAREDQTKAEAQTSKHGVKFIEPDASLKKAFDDYKKGEVQRAVDWAFDKRKIDKAFSKKVFDDFVSTYKKWKDISEKQIKGDAKKFTQILDNEVYSKVRKEYVK
jgi:TRAP-type C4-dicarboxylate transport system substrate-binding protein